MKKTIVPIIIIVISAILLAFFWLSYYYIIVYPENISSQTTMFLLYINILLPLIGIISVFLLRLERRIMIKFIIVFAVLVAVGVVTNSVLTGGGYVIPGMESVTNDYLIKGCAETDQGMTARSLDDGTVEKDPTIEVIGNKIIYSRAIEHMCCRKADFNTEPSMGGYRLDIYEFWTGEGCRCMCFSEIGIRLNDLPSGTYDINVYESGYKPEWGYKLMEEKLLISKSVIIS